MAGDAKVIALAVGTTVAVGAALAAAIRKSNDMHQSSNVEDDESSYVYQEEEVEVEDEHHHHHHYHHPNFEPLRNRTPSFTFAGSINKKKKTKTKPTSRNMQFHSCPVCDSAKEEIQY
jgi:hypothetical protein